VEPEGFKTWPVNVGVVYVIEAPVTVLTCVVTLLLVALCVEVDPAMLLIELHEPK
jgi:hypothetical protein